MKAVDQVVIRLHFASRVSRPAPSHLRGAIAAMFPDDPLFHQHEEGELLYRMPRIQYRWDAGGAMLVGLEEAARRLVTVAWPGMELRLGNDRVRITDAECTFRRTEVETVDRLLRYQFMAPWLPFSQENYKRYGEMALEDREAERDRLARAGILIGLRGLGVEVRERLLVAVEDARPERCLYKGVEMLGFTGRVLLNLRLPPGFAFGRAVSHGYGWVMPEVPTK